MRQVVLDTETTGLEPEAGHRIIEIGCVEIVNRRVTNNRFHRYVNPGRAVDAGALQVHGIENDFLATQPRFAEVVHELSGVREGRGARHSQRRLRRRILSTTSCDRVRGVPQEIRDCCGVIDTLALARRMHPGSATVSTRLPSGTASTTRSASCTARCSTRRSSPTSISR